MAVDLTTKSLDIASRVSTLSGTLIDTVRHLVALSDQATAAGIEFVVDGEPMDFSGTALKHTDGQGVVDAFSSAVATLAWLESSFNVTNFEKVRS